MSGPSTGRSPGFPWLLLPVVLVAAALAFMFFPFTADDAFIVARYARNAAGSQGLVYNPGERIMAFTSPLHVLLCSALRAVFGDSVLPNKILALAVVAGAGLCLCRALRADRHVLLLPAVLGLTSPFVMLWTVGGLETPYLLGLVTAITLILHGRMERLDAPTLGLLFSLIGVAFLTRFDSILFTAPAAAYLLVRSLRGEASRRALYSGTVIPILWLVFSTWYYGTVLPTSYFVKRPSGSFYSLVYNAHYTLQFFTLSGLSFAGVFLFALLMLGNAGVRDSVREHVARLWWAYAGVVLQLVYSLWVSSVHMMFSFRHLVPYLFVMVFLLADLFARFARVIPIGQGRRRIAFVALVGLLLLSNGAQAVAMYTRTLDVGLLGHYTRIGSRDYTTALIGVLTEGAGDVRRDWLRRNPGQNRPPRVQTFAGGALPYALEGAYIFEELVSYRFDCRIEAKDAADYIQLMTPRHGPLDQQLPRGESAYEIVSDRPTTFDGGSQRVMIFFNPAPSGRRLPPRVDGPCGAEAPPPGSGGSAGR